MSGSTESWKIEGDYFESCNCTVLCPCLLSHAQANPTEGNCDVVLAVHIKKGRYGEVDLAGLNAVQVVQTPGPMAQGNGILALYVDSRGTPEQRKALEHIFSGDAGGPPSLITGMIAKRLPVREAAIEVTKTDQGLNRLSIPNVADIEVEAIEGAPGKAVWLENVWHPFSARLAAARGRKSHYKDHALTFDNSGRNGHFAPINWAAG
jgi:hypothetical protein